jgi:DNA-binding CsgD family transcriptional regulator
VKRVLLLVPDRHLPLAILSAVEQEIVWMLVRAKSPKWIAHGMGMSHLTLVSHLAHVMTELGIHTRAELTAWALSNLGAMAGYATPPELHPDGCLCGSPYCTGMRAVAQMRDATGQVGRIIVPVPLIVEVAAPLSTVIAVSRSL